jgi:hypothetical protein
VQPAAFRAGLLGDLMVGQEWSADDHTAIASVAFMLETDLGV